RDRGRGLGSCSGCTIPVTLTLDTLQLLQRPELEFDPILTTPKVANITHWQGAEQESLPLIFSFEPSSGGDGTPVTLRGIHFTGTHSVRFGSLEASFSVTSDSVIQAVAPTGVRTSLIVVTTAKGS